MEDGTFALHKSISNRSVENTFDQNNLSIESLNPPQSPSLWKKSPGITWPFIYLRLFRNMSFDFLVDSIAAHIATKQVDGKKEREENEAAAKDLNNMWESLSASEQSPWHESYLPDFGNECYNFLRQAGLQIPIDPTSKSIILPQSIAVDEKRVYVTDVINSVVYFFFDGNFKGKFSMIESHRRQSEIFRYLATWENLHFPGASLNSVHK